MCKGILIFLGINGIKSVKEVDEHQKDMARNNATATNIAPKASGGKKIYEAYCLMYDYQPRRP